MKGKLGYFEDWMKRPARFSIRRRRLTWPGALYLLGALAFWGMGLWKAINLISLLASLLLVLWVMNFILAGRPARHLRLKRWIEEPIFAGAPATVHVEVINQSRKTLSGLRLVDRGPSHDQSWFAALFAGQEKHRFSHEIVPPRRGWYTGEPLRLVSSYPLGLMECRLTPEPARPVLVFPALGRLHRGRLRRWLSQAAESIGRIRRRPVRHPAAQSEFHGLREFRTGDSPRWIHWRTSAHRGELMVREFEEAPTDNLVLILDPWVPAEAESETAGTNTSPRWQNRSSPELEEAISLAATICWEWCRQKGDTLVLAVAGPAPQVVAGITGLNLANLALECLALLSGHTQKDDSALVERLSALSLPAAPTLVLTTRPTGLGDELARILHRPVTTLDVSAGLDYDFYEKASGHEA